MTVDQPPEWHRDPYVVSCDPARFDLATIAAFLAGSYWAKGIPAEVVERSVESSLGFALLDGERQVGFARVVSDYATFAYLADVFVLPERRGLGLGRWLVSCVLDHPRLQGLGRWLLATRDAHELYRRVGFTPLAKPEIFMERHDPEVYARPVEQRLVPPSATAAPPASEREVAHGRLLDGLPVASLAEERFEELVRRPGARFERIVSSGQRSPDGFWYDQAWGEWVLLVEGSACVEVEGVGAIELRPGDWLDLPPHRRHRVARTADDGPTVWLAVHYGEPAS